VPCVSIGANRLCSPLRFCVSYFSQVQTLLQAGHIHEGLFAIAYIFVGLLNFLRECFAPTSAAFSENILLDSLMRDTRSGPCEHAVHTLLHNTSVVAGGRSW